MSSKRRPQTLAGLGIALVAIAATGVALTLADSSHGPPPSAKEQFIAHEQQQLAEAQAGPRAAKPPESSIRIAAPTPCVPPITLPYPDGLIHDAGQGGPFGSSANFRAVSSWTGSASANGPVYAVWSGATGLVWPTPGESAVDVYTERVSSDGCGVDFTTVGVFADPNATGVLTITSVSGATMQLSSPTSTVFFDLIQDVFSATPP